jgi:hypothetical protein
VYAFGIVLWELACRDTYFSNVKFLWQITDNVLAGVRPPVPAELQAPAAYLELLGSAWQNDPKARPSMAAAKMTLTGLCDQLRSS